MGCEAKECFDKKPVFKNKDRAYTKERMEARLLAGLEPVESTIHLQVRGDLSF
jgi:hypothetical protein